MRTFSIFAPIAILTMSGCFGSTLDYGSEPTTTRYTEPQVSRLSTIRPYPNRDDVCQEIKATGDIQEPSPEGSLLIACPKHERGALQDRLTEGAQIVGHTKHWTVLVVPPNS